MVTQGQEEQEQVPVGKLITITFNHDHSFRGASSHAKYSCKAGEAVEIGKDEITHLDKNDYVLGKVVKEYEHKKK